MFQNSRRKNLALVALFFLVMLLSYKLAIRKTIDVRKEYLSLKAEEESFQNLPQQLALLSKKEMYLDSILRKLDLGNTSMENSILRTINREAAKNNLNVIDFNPPHVFQQNGTDHTTYNFTFRGNYTDILKALYTIETQSKFGEVSHLNFLKRKNYRTRKPFLEATVFLQKLE